MDGVDGRNQRIEADRLTHPRISHHPPEGRGRIGKPRGLDHDPPRTIEGAAGQHPDGLGEIVAGGTAEAAIGEKDHIVPVDRLGEDGIVDADRSEFVDDHRGP